MASYNPGKVIKGLRMRKKMRQELLLGLSEHSKQTVSRMENGRQTPRKATVHDFLSEVDMRMNRFFCPYLDGVAPGIHRMRTQLLHCLDEPDDENALQEAKNIIERFENMDMFKGTLNLHFLLSCKARYNEIVRGDPLTTRKLIEQGISVTFPEYEMGRDMNHLLIFEEAAFLHTYALMAARTAPADAAVKTLNGIWQGLKILPEDDKEKGKKLAKILLTLTDCLIQAGDNAQALEVCSAGNDASLKYCRGRYTPAFLHRKAACLWRMGRRKESGQLFTYAYFGYLLFHQKAQAEKVRSEAKALAGFTIHAYGADTLAFEPIRYHREYDTSIEKFNSLGEMFYTWRKQAGLTLETLSRGLCNKGYLQKIEKDAVKQPNVYLLEALAERLGRDHNYYFNTFVSGKTLKEKNMRNEILALLVLRDYDKAESLLLKLKESRDYRKGVNRQFILNAQSSLYLINGGYDARYLRIVMEAIRLTIPDFEEENIARYPSTHIERLLINKLANYYANNNDMPRAAKITALLIERVNIGVIDETEKHRSQGMLLYNYAKNWGRQGRYQQMLQFTEEGLALAVQSRQLLILPELYMNKGHAIYHLRDNLEACMPYFAMAYYGAALVNGHGNKEDIAHFVKAHVGRLFE